MFTFSFRNSVSEEESQKSDCHKIPDLAEVPHFTAERVSLSPSSISGFPFPSDKLLSVQINHIDIVYLSVDLSHRVLKTLYPASNIIQFAENLHSDLIPGEYEGGLKVWECTLDLLEWLFKDGQAVDFKGKQVLDLGCGGGILGIAALKNGAFVTFQDYNKEVIQASTIPNVLSNLYKQEKSEMLNVRELCDSSCEFFCGDWTCFVSALENCEDDVSKFDFILTSETIYNSQNHEKLYNVFKKCLKKSGIVFLAAKTYYFGVGGSLRQFQAMIEEDGLMECDVLWKCSNGVQREIMKIAFTRPK